jgi:hypothetical protein
VDRRARAQRGDAPRGGGGRAAGRPRPPSYLEGRRQVLGALRLEHALRRLRARHEPAKDELHEALGGEGTRLLLPLPAGLRLRRRVPPQEESPDRQARARRLGSRLRPAQRPRASARGPRADDSGGARGGARRPGAGGRGVVGEARRSGPQEERLPGHGRRGPHHLRRAARQARRPRRDPRARPPGARGDRRTPGPPARPRAQRGRAPGALYCHGSGCAGRARAGGTPPHLQDAPAGGEGTAKRHTRVWVVLGGEGGLGGCEPTPASGAGNSASAS